MTLPHPLARDNAPEPLLTIGASKPAKTLSGGSGASVGTVYKPSAVRPDAKSKKQKQSKLFMDSESSSSSSDETLNHPLPLPEKDPPSVLPAVVPVMSDPLGVNLEDAIDADPLSLAHQDSIALSGEGKRGKSDSESSSSSGGTQATTGALGGTDIHVHLHVLPEIPGFEAGAAHLKEEIETVRHTQSLCIYTCILG